MDREVTELSSEWRATNILFPRRSVATGMFITGPVMTRVMNGKTVYREMTTEEAFDLLKPGPV
jgi:hypothetical protein